MVNRYDHIQVEISDNEGRDWVVLGNGHPHLRWVGTGSWCPQWTKDYSPRWYRQTDLRTAGMISAVALARREERIRSMAEEHQSLIRLYDRLDEAGKAVFLKDRFHHDLIWRPYKCVMDDFAKGYYANAKRR